MPDNSQNVNLRPFVKGKVITADQLNESVDQINRQSFGVDAPKQKDSPRTFPLQQFILVTVNDDTLTCHTWDGTTEGTDNITVAKPHALRKTEWDGLTIAGITYTYASAIERTASNGSDPDEDQQITPDYIEGTTVIYAARCITTGIAGVILVDVNADGRAWALKPS